MPVFRRRLLDFAGGKHINNNASIYALTFIMCQVYLKSRLQIAERRLGDKCNPFVHASKMSVVYHMVDIKALVPMPLSCTKYFKTSCSLWLMCGVCTCVANNW